MARDDYDRIVCIILTYLYARLKGKTEVGPEIYLQPMTKDFPISEEYFYFVIDSMLKEEYIDGITLVRVWGGDIINITGMSKIQITAAGIHYLCENSTMKKVLEWLRDNAIALPGVVTTVVSILQKK